MTSVHMSALVTLPAPRVIRSPKWAAQRSMTVTAPGTVIVISATGMPPSTSASTARTTLSDDSARTTGTTPIRVRFAITFCLSTDYSYLAGGGRCSTALMSPAVHPALRNAAGEHPHDFLGPAGLKLLDGIF